MSWIEDMPEEEDPDVLADKWGETDLDNERFIALFEEEYERDYDQGYEDRF